MKYPDEVLTTSKKGKIEVRSLVDCGEFISYEYIDPNTGLKTEDKIKLILKSKKGIEEFFIIPMKDKRSLLIPLESKGPRKVWDANSNQPLDL